MNDAEIYEFIKSDITWHKPTQSFSSADNFFKILWKNALKGENNSQNTNINDFDIKKFRFDQKAFSILGLRVGQDWKKIQQKFKILVKKFHPDMNLGNNKFEDKLKVITLAYTQLKKTYKNKK